MSFTESLQSVFQNYAVFEGRARRSEYWWFCLAYSLVSSVISGVARAFVSGGASMALSSISAIIAVACLVPSIAVTTRRLHDTGRSGWWQLLSLTCIGGIVVIVWLAMDSQPGDNQYGPNPKGM